MNRPGDRYHLQWRLTSTPRQWRIWDDQQKRFIQDEHGAIQLFTKATAIGWVKRHEVTEARRAS